MRHVNVAILSLMFAAAASPAIAQFSSSVQGTVTDSSGAVIPSAQVTLTSDATKVVTNVKSGSDGIFRFPSLAPGNYTITVDVSGFMKASTKFLLTTAENRDVSLTLRAGNSSTVEVTTQQALLDASDSRLQYTIDSNALSDLPLSTRNPTSLIGITPGVTGGLDIQKNNLNTNPENFIDASSGGHGENGNSYVVDGLDVTSNIRPGVVTLTPGADGVQEVAVQTNTYSVEYGRGGGVQALITTKGGTDTFHGYASDYYTYQGLAARGEFGPSYANVPKILPYHSHNAAFGVGGPLWRSKKLFFFGTYQPYSYEGSNYGTVYYEDPAFTAFAQQVRPNSPELQLFTKYPVTGATGANVVSLASDYFGTSCNTAQTDFIPCSLPIQDAGILGFPNVGRAKQYSARADKYFSKDRTYVNFVRNRTDNQNSAARRAFQTTTNFFGLGLQANETHTFSAKFLNEAALAIGRNEGIEPATGHFSVPVVNAAGLGTSFGSGFAQGDYIQHSYHWRDVVTLIHGRHAFRLGYEGFHGDDIKQFEGPYSQPTFYYQSLIDMINDNPYYEGGVSYNFLTGTQEAGNNAFAITTGSAFVQDTAKVGKRVTVTYGLRYDNYGNPYGVDANTIGTAFHLGPGSDFATQIANGVLSQQSHLLDRSLKWNFSPRAGASWDVTGSGKWVASGGVGIYKTQITVGNMADITSGNPPNYVLPGFLNDGSTKSKPLFSIGTSDRVNFGYQYPTYQGGALDAKGGQVGNAVSIGATDPGVHSPTSVNYSFGIQRALGTHLVGATSFVGSHTDGILLGGLAQGADPFGYDVNAKPGDLIANTTCTAGPNNTDNCVAPRTRLNTSFGAINYQYNVGRANYESLVTSLRGRFGSRAFFVASYTLSVAKDSATFYYPTASFDQNRFYGSTSYDTPQRFSFGGSFVTPALLPGNAFVSRVTRGFTVGSTVTLQSGTPLIIATSNPYGVSRIDTTKPVSATNLKYNQNSGDFQGTGYNYAFVNVSPTAKAMNSRTNYKGGPYIGTGPGQHVAGGVFPNCNFLPSTCTLFSTPAFGQQASYVPSGQFRNPGFAQTDMSLQKTTKIAERFSLNLRADAFNLFNQVNFYGLDGNLADYGFGTTGSTHTARYMQLGATVNF